MKIENGWLDEAEKLPSPNFGGRWYGMYVPRVGMIHYNAGTWESTRDWLTSDASKASYHFLIRRHSGDITQFVPTEEAAWAVLDNVSWDGRNKWNGRMVHVCLENFGQLDADGKTRGIEVPPEWRYVDTDGAKHHRYMAGELDKCFILCRYLTRELGIEKWVRHSDVDPDRKVDPGPNFPWSSFTNLMEKARSEVY